MIAAFMPDWSVELHYDEQRKATIVMMPDDVDSANFPTLIVRGEASAFHLEELLGDAYQDLGEYRSWIDVVRAVRIRLMWDMPVSMTLH